MKLEALAGRPLTYSPAGLTRDVPTPAGFSHDGGAADRSAGGRLTSPAPVRGCCPGRCTGTPGWR